MRTTISILTLILFFSAAFATPVPAPVSNTLETLGVFAVLILLIFISAAWSNIKIIGVVGAFLLILLGIWIYMDGIYYYVGDKMTETATTVYAYNKTNMYEQVSASVVNIAGVTSANLGNLIGLVLVLLGMYALMYYAMGIFGYGGRSE
jgi:hypothetical protein